MFEIDWQQLFGVETSLAELFVRGTAMYWFLFLLFRFVMRREVGGVGLADVLIIVIVADAAQNGMTGDYQSVTEGFVIVGTLIFWNLFTDWAGFHWRAFERFAEPPPLLLVRDGKVLERNLKREYLTRDELLSKLREHGVESPQQVRWAYLESDGQLSVAKYERTGPEPTR